jgi:hypothetical protein
MSGNDANKMNNVVFKKVEAFKHEAYSKDSIFPEYIIDNNSESLDPITYFYILYKHINELKQSESDHMPTRIFSCITFKNDNNDNDNNDKELNFCCDYFRVSKSKQLNNSKQNIKVEIGLLLLGRNGDSKSSLEGSFADGINFESKFALCLNLDEYGKIKSSSLIPSRGLSNRYWYNKHKQDKDITIKNIQISIPYIKNKSDYQSLLNENRDYINKKHKSIVNKRFSHCFYHVSLLTLGVFLIALVLIITLLPTYLLMSSMSAISFAIMFTCELILDAILIGNIINIISAFINPKRHPITNIIYSINTCRDMYKSYKTECDYEFCIQEKGSSKCDILCNNINRYLLSLLKNTKDKYNYKYDPDIQAKTIGNDIEYIVYNLALIGISKDINETYDYYRYSIFKLQKNKFPDDFKFDIINNLIEPLNHIKVKIEEYLKNDACQESSYFVHNEIYKEFEKGNNLILNNVINRIDKVIDELCTIFPEVKHRLSSLCKLSNVITPSENRELRRSSI